MLGHTCSCVRGPSVDVLRTGVSMREACVTVQSMSKMIQIRNVPDELHREAKARAARAGMSLSEFLLREVERALAAPPVEQLLEARARRGRTRVAEPPEAAVRRERDTR